MPGSGFGQFLRAFAGSWFTKMSGPLSVPFTIVAVFVRQVWIRILLVVLAVFCAVSSSYTVWRKERERFLVEQAKNQRPELKGSVANVESFFETETSCRVQITAWVRNERPLATGARIVDASLKDKAGRPLFLRTPGGVAPSSDLEVKLQRNRLEHGMRVEGIVRLLADTPTTNIDAASATLTIADDFDQQLVLRY